MEKCVGEYCFKHPMPGLLAGKGSQQSGMESGMEKKGEISAEFREALEGFKASPQEIRHLDDCTGEVGATDATPPYPQSGSPVHGPVEPTPKRPRLSSPTLPDKGVASLDKDALLAPFPDPRLDEYLAIVAQDGLTHVPWELLKPVFLWKLEGVCRAMLRLTPLQPHRLAPKNIRHVPGLEFLHVLLTTAASLPGTPFTIQARTLLLIPHRLPSLHLSSG